MCLGTRNLEKMGKLGNVLPVTTSTSMIGSLAVSGLPPFNGFFSKMIIIIAAIESGYFSAAFIAVLGSILTLGYFMKVQRYGFHGDKIIDKVDLKPGVGMKIAMVSLAILCLVSSCLIFPQMKNIIMDPVIDTILDHSNYIALVIGG